MLNLREFSYWSHPQNHLWKHNHRLFTLDYKSWWWFSTFFGRDWTRVNIPSEIKPCHFRRDDMLWSSVTFTNAILQTGREATMSIVSTRRFCTRSVAWIVDKWFLSPLCPCPRPGFRHTYLLTYMDLEFLHAIFHVKHIIHCKCL